MSKSKTNNITIPHGSLVLMCGAPNSGKTTFTQKHFKNKKNIDVFCSDELFMKAMKNSTIFDTFEKLQYKTEHELVKGILEGAEKGNTVVLDSVSCTPDLRNVNITAFREYFKNIVLIVLDLDIKDLLSHGTKPMTPEKIRFNLFPPNSKQCSFIAMGLKSQIASGEIGEGVDLLHIITSENLNNVEIVIA